MAPPPPRARPAAKEPNSIDSDDNAAASHGSGNDSDGFEIVGGPSPARGRGLTASGAPAQRRAQTTEEPGVVPASVGDTLRALIPDRAQLERERLERARRRAEQRAEPARLSPTQRTRELDGRPPAAMLDRQSAKESILAERDAQRAINDAMRHAGLGFGTSKGVSLPSSNDAAAPLPSTSTAPPTASTSAGQASKIPSTDIYWWKSMGAPSTGGSTSRPESNARAGNASAAPTSKREPRAPSKPSKPGPQDIYWWNGLGLGDQSTAKAPSTSSSRRDGPSAASRTQNADQSSTLSKSSTQRVRSAMRSPSPRGEPPSKKQRVIPKPQTDLGAESTYLPYEQVKLTDRFWRGTVKMSFNQYADESVQGVHLASLIQPRGQVSASQTLSSSSSTPATRLEEVLAASYCYMLPWLKKEIIPTGKTWAQGGTCPDVTFLTHSGSPDQKGIMPPIADLPNWTVIVPIHPNFVAPSGSSTSSTFAPRIGVLHCKFFLLFYPGSHMRFILLSGNLCDYDWARIENAAFVQDFPVLSAADQADERVRQRKSTSSPFGIELVKLLDSMGLSKSHSARTRLSSYDMSGAVGSLVISAPQKGVLTGWDQVDRFGLGRLGAVVRAPFLTPSSSTPGTSGVGLQLARGGVDLEAQGSSLGDLRPRWLQHFHLLASGINPHAGAIPALPLPASSAARATQRYGDTLYPAASAASAASVYAKGKGRMAGLVPPPNAGLVSGSSSSGGGTSSGPSSLAPPPPRKSTRVPSRGQPSDLTWPPVRICFPSERWVKNEALEGVLGAGTFFGKKQKFLESGCKHIFYQPVSKRAKVMMHAKTILALQPGFELEDALCVRAPAEGRERTAGGAVGGGAGVKPNTGQDSILVSDSSGDEDEGAEGSGTASSRGRPANGKGKASATPLPAPAENILSNQNEGTSKSGACAGAGGQPEPEPESIGWVYMGSHNFTPAAWGTLTDKKGVPSLSMSNWELGIVLPLFDARARRPSSESDSSTTEGTFDWRAHVSTLARNAIPYHRPLTPYGPDDVPWDQHTPENQALFAALGS